MFENLKGLFSKNAKSNEIAGIQEAPQNLSPGQPLEPNANVPDDTIYAYEFPMNINQNFDTTRFSREERLRYLSKPDLVRICLTKRKDQITKYGWKFVIKGTGKTDSRTEALTQFFKKPDGEHRWDPWISSIIEDHIVLDAVCIFPRRDRAGNIHSLNIIDPATIKKMVDAWGFTPLDGSPAYQQKINGLITSNWAYNELIYSIKNATSNSVHGYSAIEALEKTINLLIRRTQAQLDYFTKGNIPSLLISAPEGWKANDIFKYQKMWNELQKGPTRFGTSVMIPSDKVHNTKPEALKTELDEWIARTICLGLSLPPTALMNDNNRATAETAKASAREEGVESTLDYLANLINEIIEDHFHYSDIEFQWDINEETDPLTLSQIENSYVASGIRTINEVRAEHGWEPLEEPEPVAPDEENPETPDQKQKFLKKKL